MKCTFTVYRSSTWLRLVPGTECCVSRRRARRESAAGRGGPGARPAIRGDDCGAAKEIK